MNCCAETSAKIVDELNIKIIAIKNAHFNSRFYVRILSSRQIMLILLIKLWISGCVE